MESLLETHGDVWLAQGQGHLNHHMGWVLGSRSTIYKKVLEANLFKYFFIFFNYESRITHLQDTWKIQNKVTYSSTIYHNYF